MLGASWACHRVLERHPGAELVTATDGNHVVLLSTEGRQDDA